MTSIPVDEITICTKEEALEIKTRLFPQLKPERIFDLGMERFFICKEKADELTWRVVELTELNVKRILLGLQVEFSKITFDQMDGLNLR